MKYLFFSYDAVKIITANRFYQSLEFRQAKELIDYVMGKSDEWREGLLLGIKGKHGRVIMSNKPDKKNGVLFDLTTFNAFQIVNETDAITILGKTFRYAIKYFEKIPLVKNERELPGTPTTIVYPYAFLASRNVQKILIDRNSNKQDRKGNNYLTVYYYGNDGENQTVSFGSQNKMISDIQNMSFTPSNNKSLNTHEYVSPVTDLASLPISIDSAIGLDNWNLYLTSPQKKFINRPIEGAERLEGAAGTGKTLTLILRCIRQLRTAEEKKENCKLIFFTHSISTKDRIIEVFRKNWPDFEYYQESKSGESGERSILITTLQEWSMRHLGINSLEENEYLDKDAEDSKYYQLMYIEQAFDKFNKLYRPLYQKKISKELKKFLDEDPMEHKLDMLQREFSEIIKGQCGGIETRYLECERPAYGLRLDNDSDRRFIFGIFSEYQKSLEAIGQYDSDDIVITALGQVNSPIWNRRRIGEGYDACFIDETHLFNLNEISLFHFVNKPSSQNNIIYAIDKSQSIGDTNYIRKDFELRNGTKEKTHYSTVFRNSPDIANLAYEILSSGALLFRTLENPLENAIFTFIEQEEGKCRFPEYIHVRDNEEILQRGLRWVIEYLQATRCQRSDVLIIASDNNLLVELQKYASSINKPFVTLKSRSDNSTLREAKEWNKFVFSHIDYVGGLEFDAVVILGAENERIPPATSVSALHVAKFSWFNRLYIAVTRAKYAVAFFGIQSKGMSELLRGALEKNALTEKL